MVLYYTYIITPTFLWSKRTELQKEQKPHKLKFSVVVNFLSYFVCVTQ